MLLLFFACLLLSLSARTFAASTPIRFAGQNAELVLSEISARTLRIELFALDEQGRSRPPTPSTVRAKTYGHPFGYIPEGYPDWPPGATPADYIPIS